MMTVAVVALVAGLPGTASAKPKIALTAIDGDSSGAVGDAVFEALDGDDLSLIAQRTVNKAVDKLGLDADMTEKQAKKLSTEIEADAVVIGKLDKSGKNKTLHFTLYIHGKKARGFTVTFNNAKSDRFKVKLRDKMVTKIAGETGTVEDKGKKKKGDEGDEEDPLGTKGKGKKVKDKDKDEKKISKKDKDEDEGDEDDDAKKKKKKKKKKVASEDEDESDEDEVAIHRAAPLHSANRVAARLDVGVSVQNRAFTYNSRANFPERPKAFNNQPVPGGRFEAELYPLAFSNPKSVASGLGLAAEYDKTLLLTLHTSTEATVPIKANQQHYSFGVRLRLVFGKTSTSPSLTLGIGYGKRQFTTDRHLLTMASSLDLPDTKYTTIDPGLALRAPFAPQIALILGGRGLIITDAGPIQAATSYGRAKVFGVTAFGGIDIVLGNRFAIRLVGEFSQIGFAFTGTGDQARNRDMDPATKDVGGATDRSIGGSATLAVLY